MRASVTSLSKKLISTFFAATLAFGLVPSAAFAADDSLSLIPEGDGDAASIASSAEGGSDDVFSHYPSDDSSSVDGGSVDTPSEDVSNSEVDDTPAIPKGEIINEIQPLQVVAQRESIRSYFLAQTLESTRSVPVVSAQLPVDTSSSGISPEGEDDESVREIPAESTIIGSFDYLGMTFAIEANGSSVALVAVDYAKLPQEFIEKQVIAIPGMATPNGIDNYSVTRIANDAFASLTKENTNLDYVGCEVLFSDEELLAEAGVDPIDLSEIDSLTGCAGILALSIPVVVTSIEDNAFSGFDTLQYIVVSDNNSTYASYDGALYSADLANLRLIPEGRVGAVCVAPSATTVEPEVFSHCPLVDTLVADADCETGFEWGCQGVKRVDNNASNIEESLLTCVLNKQIEWALEGVQLVDDNPPSRFLDSGISRATFGATNKAVTIKYWSNGQWNAWVTYNAAYLRKVPNQNGTYSFQFRSSSSTSWNSAATGSNWTFCSFSASGPFYSFEANEEYEITGDTFYMSMLSGGTDYVDRTFKIVLWYNNMWNDWVSGTGAAVRKNESETSCVFQYRKKDSSNWLRLSYGVRWLYYGWSASGPFTALGNQTEIEVKGSVLYLSMYPGGAVNCYSVTWHDDGATSASKPSNISSAPSFLVPSNPEASDSAWSFAGWYDNPSFTGTALPAAGESVTLSSNKDYYAKWTRSVVFDYQDGHTANKTVTATKVYDSPTMRVDASIAKPSDDGGWKFAGWATAQTGTSFDTNTTDAITTASTVIPVAPTYYGRWKATVAHVTTSGASTVGSQTVWRSYSAPASFVEYALPAGPASSVVGKHFGGWCVTSGNAYVEGAPATNVLYQKDAKLGIKGSITVTARYDSDLLTVNWFDNDGTTLLRTMSDVVYATTFGSLDAEASAAQGILTAKPGYTMIGWNTSPSATSALDASTVLTSEVVDLYPIYQTKDVVGVDLLGKDGIAVISAVYLKPDLGFVMGPSGTAAETFATADDVVVTPPSLRGYGFLGFYDGDDVLMIDTAGRLTEAALDTREVAEGTRWSSKWEADLYTIAIHLDGGEEEDWPTSFDDLTYDDPTISLSIASGAPKKPGYIFQHFVAYASPDATGEPVNVFEAGSTTPTNVLVMGKTYEVLDLMDGDDESYDIASIKAVWTPRIAVVVPTSVSLGVLADFACDSLRFQYQKSAYDATDTENSYAPLEFISYTTAPLGIVAVADDETFTVTAARIFENRHKEVSLTISAATDETSVKHDLRLGEAIVADEGYLKDLVIEAAGDTATKTTLWLGMDFGALKPIDVKAQDAGSIARLHYTVALLNSDGSTTGDTVVIAPYDGEGILW